MSAQPRNGHSESGVGSGKSDSTYSGNSDKIPAVRAPIVDASETGVEGKDVGHITILDLIC
jgi:hypothetical protein